MITDILLALAVVGAVGLVAGILLAVISHFFSVPQDARERDLREKLPGANCGACGYKGCDDYARAMSEGKAKPNLCIPGGDDIVAELSKLLGTEAGSVEKKSAFVRCNGNCEATSKKAEYSGVSTCRAASAIYGGPNACTYGCLGLGDCATVCPADAICIKDGIAHVDPRLCVGCGMCVSTCPKALISLRPAESAITIKCNSHDKGADARKLCKNACIGCKKCEKACPAGAISVNNNLAVIDYSKCTGCGICAENCPTKCINNVSFAACVAK